MDENNQSPVQTPKKKPTKKQIIIITASALVLALVIAGTLLFNYMFGGLNRDTNVGSMTAQQLGGVGGSTITRGGDGEDQTEPDVSSSIETNVMDAEAENVELPEELSVYIGKGTKSVSTLLPGYEKIKVLMLYGTDLEDLSDCNIICAIDPIHSKIKLISIARDTYVYYSDLGISSKLNHAFNWGGPSLAIKTLNENFSMNIEDYVAVNWDQMQDIVNYLHGVWVYLDYDEWVGIGSPAKYEYNKWVKLYGLHARKYAGLRLIDDDFHRMNRQKEILRSMFNIAKNVKFSKYPSLARYGLNMCTTSLDYSEIIDLSTIMLDDDLTLECYTFPPDDDTYAWGGNIDDVFYFVYDLDKASDEIYKIIYEDYYVSGYVEPEPEPTPTPATNYYTPSYQAPVESEALPAESEAVETTEPTESPEPVETEEPVEPVESEAPDDEIPVPEEGGEVTDAPQPSEEAPVEPTGDGFGSILGF